MRQFLTSPGGYEVSIGNLELLKPSGDSNKDYFFDQMLISLFWALCWTRPNFGLPFPSLKRPVSARILLC